jgi:hypothetical protein
VPVSDGGGHGGDACLDVNKLGIEVFSGKGWSWRTNRGAKRWKPVVSSAGSGGPRISITLFGRVPGDGVGD